MPRLTCLPFQSGYLRSTRNSSEDLSYFFRAEQVQWTKPDNSSFWKGQITLENTTNNSGPSRSHKRSNVTGRESMAECFNSLSKPFMSSRLGRKEKRKSGSQFVESYLNHKNPAMKSFTLHCGWNNGCAAQCKCSMHCTLWTSSRGRFIALFSEAVNNVHYPSITTYHWFDYLHLCSYCRSHYMVSDTQAKL